MITVFSACDGELARKNSGAPLLPFVIGMAVLLGEDGWAGAMIFISALAWDSRSRQASSCMVYRSLRSWVTCVSFDTCLGETGATPGVTLSTTWRTSTRLSATRRNHASLPRLCPPSSPGHDPDRRVLHQPGSLLRHRRDQRRVGRPLVSGRYLGVVDTALRGRLCRGCPNCSCSCHLLVPGSVDWMVLLWVECPPRPLVFQSVALVFQWTTTCSSKCRRHQAISFSPVKSRRLFLEPNVQNQDLLVRPPARRRSRHGGLGGRPSPRPADRGRCQDHRSGRHCCLTNKNQQGLYVSSWSWTKTRPSPHFREHHAYCNGRGAGPLTPLRCP